MIFNKKNIFVAILSFTIFGLNLNATTAEELELATAVLRIPAVIGANTVGKQSGIAPKIILIASDLIRLSNEILTIVNKRGKFDFYIYDCCWGVYDAYNLIVHVKSLFGDKADNVEKIESKEIKKFKLAIRSLHQVILPLVEGMSAILKSYPDDPKLKIQNFQAFRNRCGAICSLSRLLDNLIISEPQSAEFYAYIILLVVNIVVAYGIDGAQAVKTFSDGDCANGVQAVKTFSDGDCALCLCPFVRGEKVKRLGCGHVFHHCRKNGHGDCFDQFANKCENSAVCPLCNFKRDVDLETDIKIVKTSKS